MAEEFQINLPLDHGSTVSTEALNKLIWKQGLRLELQKFEITLLNDTCSRVGCLGQGLSQLYQYAGYQDKVFKKLQHRHKNTEELFEYLNVIENGKASKRNISNITQSIRKTAYSLMSLISSICLWRSSQWSPRPLQELYEHRKTHLHDIIKAQALKLVKYLKLVPDIPIANAGDEMEIGVGNSGFGVANGLKPQLNTNAWLKKCDSFALSFLLSPVLNAKEIEQLFDSHGYSSNVFREHMNREQKEYCQLYLTLIGSVGSFLELEDKICSFWHSRVHVIKESEFRIISTCPLLRLPYLTGPSVSGVNVSPPISPCVDFNWFSFEVEKYSAIHNILERCLEKMTRDRTDTLVKCVHTIPLEITIKPSESNPANIAAETEVSCSELDTEGSRRNRTEESRTGTSNPDKPSEISSACFNRTTKSTILTASRIIDQQQVYVEALLQSTAAITSDNLKFVPVKKIESISMKKPAFSGTLPNNVTLSLTKTKFEIFSRNIPYECISAFFPKNVLETLEVQHKLLEPYIAQRHQSVKNKNKNKVSLQRKTPPKSVACPIRESGCASSPTNIEEKFISDNSYAVEMSENKGESSYAVCVEIESPIAGPMNTTNAVDTVSPIPVGDETHFMFGKSIASDLSDDEDDLELGAESRSVQLPGSRPGSPCVSSTCSLKKNLISSVVGNARPSSASLTSTNCGPNSSAVKARPSSASIGKAYGANSTPNSRKNSMLSPSLPISRKNSKMNYPSTESRRRNSDRGNFQGSRERIGTNSSPKQSSLLNVSTIRVDFNGTENGRVKSPFKTPLKTTSSNQGLRNASGSIGIDVKKALFEEMDVLFQNSKGGRVLPKGYTKRGVHAVGLISSLSKPFTRGEARAEGTTLLTTLKNIDLNALGLSIHLLAVRKIEAWWRWIFPIFRLKNRKATKRFVSDCIDDVLVMVYSTSGRRRENRTKMVLDGAAIKIVRYFRRYVRSFVPFIRKFQRVWRKYRSRHAVRIGKKSEAIAKEMKMHDLRSFKWANRGQAPPKYAGLVRAKGVNSCHGVSKVVSKRVRAVIIIQSVFRRHIARLNVCCLRYCLRLLGYRVVAFVKRLQYKRLLPKIRAATKINKIIRGMLCRTRFYLVVSSGIVITTAYRRYQARLAIRKQLHRVDRPVRLTLHGLRDIPKRWVYTDSLSVKVSVYWNQLLHIVSQADFASIVSSKKPGLVYTSKMFALTPQVNVTRSGKSPSSPGKILPSRSGESISASSSGGRIERTGDGGGFEESKGAGTCLTLPPLKLIESCIPAGEIPHPAFSQSGSLDSNVLCALPEQSYSDSVQLAKPSALKPDRVRSLSTSMGNETNGDDNRSKSCNGGAVSLGSKSLGGIASGLNSDGEDSSSTSSGIRMSGNIALPRNRRAVRGGGSGSVAVDNTPRSAHSGGGIQLNAAALQMLAQQHEVQQKSGIAVFSAAASAALENLSDSVVEFKSFLGNQLFGKTAMQARMNAQAVANLGENMNVKCSFDDLCIDIPSCHGCSVIKFDFFDGQ